jgi:hypothetical protein
VMRVLGSDEDRSDAGWIARHLISINLPPCEIAKGF